ncbi:MAG: HEAT repeat domain-containing protein [Planctomycetes bacterium]|nr:HEAT repeat domain-containing protein [Planctomycetota bacterium]
MRAIRIRQVGAFALVAAVLFAPAARAEEAVQALPEVESGVEDPGDLSAWQEVVNVLTAPFRFLGLVFYYSFKFIFYDVWAALVEWIAGSSDLGAALEDLQSPDPALRRAAAIRLGRLGDPDAVEPLAKLLADPEPAVRRAAVLALSELGGEEAAEAVRSALADPDVGMRGAAALALGRVGGPSDVPRLKGMLEREENRHWYVESSVVTAVGKLGGPAEVAFLRPFLDRPAEGEGWVVVASAAYALGRAGDSGSRNRLVALVDSDVQAVRSAAADALGRLGDLEMLRKIVSERTEVGPVRAALGAIGRHGAPADRELLLRMSYHPDPQVVDGALFALRAAGDRRAVERAIDLLGGENSYLRFLAAGLLRRWTGQDFGLAPARWKEWWEEAKEGFEFADEMEGD